MFAKLSALALLLPFVSALSINCPSAITIGASVDVTIQRLTTDALNADFYIQGPGVDIKLDANVALDATVTFDIPSDKGLQDHAGYIFIATTVGKPDEVLAESVPFLAVQ